MTYRVEFSGKNDLIQVVSDRILSADDFLAIESELKTKGIEAFDARRTGFVSAQQVGEGGRIRVATSFDGVETENWAEPGDWIVANMDKSFDNQQPPNSDISVAESHVVRDEAGSYDRYVLKPQNFAKRYEATSHRTSQGVVYRSKTPQHPVRAVALPGGFDIIAPWGERQRRSVGYLLLSHGDVYGIYGPSFDMTYERTDGM